MPKFDVVDCHVAIDPDKLNTVPKRGVTAPEIALLQTLHGKESIHEIMPRGSVERPNRTEYGRLLALYGKARNERAELHVERLFPGGNVQSFAALADLDLNDNQFAATRRAGRGSDGAHAEAEREEEAGVALATAAPGESDIDEDAEDRAAGLVELPADAPPQSALA